MAAANSLPFVIPKCIRRSKTAMLKALSATVGVDKTAPHFSFIDDPTTIPTTQRDKRDCFLAKEFGRRAARQLSEDWPTLFMFDRDKPRLEAFRPEKLPMLAEAENVDENSLRQLIESKHVKGALKVFERLREKEAEVSQDTIQELFSLIAYFNAKDPPPSENEEWHGIRALYRDPPSSTSETAELVSLLYSMAEKNATNLSTMICWLCKYSNETSKKRALDLFNEAKQKKWALEEDAYIQLIQNSTNTNEVNGFLKHMADAKLKPSIRTFNAALDSVSKFENFEQKWNAIQGCLGEAARIGLEPNLTTYYYVLDALRPDYSDAQRDKFKLAVNCLSEVLDKLDAQETIQCQQFTDQKFFNAAMYIATMAKDMLVMDRIEELYRSEKNQVKMSAFTVESAFYSRYLYRKISRLNDIEEVGELYRSLVPRIVSVNRDLVLKMIDKVRGTKNWRLIKRVIEDGLNARYLLDKEILQKFSKLLSEVEPNEEVLSVTEVDEFEKLIVRIVDYLLEFANFSDEYDKRLHHRLTPQTIGEFSVLLLRTSRKDKAWTLLDMLLRSDEFSNAVEAEGYPNQDCLLEAFNVAVKDGSLKNAATCLQLISRYNPSYSLNQLVEQLGSKFQLVDSQKQVLLEFSRP